MGYYLGNSKINIKGLQRIYPSETGDVYKYKGDALKIFRDEVNPPLDEETADIMMHIKTDRILMPKNLLFYNASFRGFTFRLVPRKGNGKRLIMLPKDELIGNIALIERDIEKLSSKSILLDGVKPKNAFFNGDLFLIDPSKYSVLEDCDYKSLEPINKAQFHLLITELMAYELRDRSSDKPLEKKLKELMSFRDTEEDTSAFISDMLGDSDSVKQFLKKI